MWESMVRLVETGYGWFVLFIIILGIVCARQGWLHYKSEKIRFGRDESEKERLILKDQIEYAYRMCQGFEPKIPKFDGYDYYRAKYIIELCYDEIVKWIYFNHIANQPTYIENKQEIVWSVISSNVSHKKLTSDGFKKEVDDYVEHIIRRLVIIREGYNK